jgi:hypothetical protein
VHLGFCCFFFPLRLSFLFVSSLPFFYVCSDARGVFFCTSICHVPHLASLEFFWHREQYKFVLRIFRSSLSLSLLPCRCRHSRGGFFFFFSLFGKPVSVFTVQSDFVSGFFCTGCSVVVSELEEIFRSSLLLHTHLSWHVDCGMLYDNTLSTNGSPPYLSHHHGRRRGTLFPISSSSCLCFWNARLNFLSSSKPSELSPSVVKNSQEEL